MAGVKITGTEKTGITPIDCKAACDASANDCVGYSRSSNNTCTLLTQDNVTTNEMTADANYYSYMRLKRPTTDLYGISKQVTQVDSAFYTGYNKTGKDFKSDTVGFYKDDVARDDLNTKTQTLLNKSSKYEDNIKSVQKQYNDNNDSYKKYSDDNKSNDVINAAIDNDNYMKIVDDSDMVVLQKNTTYLIWSILAVGTVLVSMSVIRR